MRLVRCPGLKAQAYHTPVLPVFRPCRKELMTSNDAVQRADKYIDNVMRLQSLAVCNAYKHEALGVSWAEPGVAPIILNMKCMST